MFYSCAVRNRLNDMKEIFNAVYTPRFAPCRNDNVPCPLLMFRLSQRCAERRFARDTFLNGATGQPFFKYAPGHEATMLTEVRVVSKKEARVTGERTREREKGRKEGEEGETVDTSYA